MKKLFLALVITTFSGFCFAPIQLHDKPENGYKPPAATEQDLQREQRNQQTRGEVGGVPTKTDENGTPVDPANNNDKSAQHILGSAQNRIDGSSGDDKQAAQILSAAEENLKQSQSGGWGSMLLMGFVFLCVGFGAMIGFRHWVGKHVPEVSEGVKVDW